MNKASGKLLWVFLPILLTVVLSYLLQLIIVSDQEKFSLWFSGFGSFVIIVYIILRKKHEPEMYGLEAAKIIRQEKRKV